jgi:UDP-N-acetylmuramate: L-alanyl-gamma-D-glutamyl-meso-diaminopimelate ligase
LVVIGNAISRGNPEAEFVLDHKLRYCSLPELLKEFFIRGKRALVVTGTHGKTTTTSLLAWVFEHGGLNPSFFIGGIPTNLGQGARFTDSEWFILEGDEYDTAFFDKRAKFVHYRPRTLILNNLEYDHADIYPDIAAIRWQFAQLLRTVPGSGRIVRNGADAELETTVAAGCWTPCQTFGMDGADEWSATLAPGKACGEFTVLRGGRAVAEVRWQLLGRHNVMNALAAIAAA